VSVRIAGGAGASGDTPGMMRATPKFALAAPAVSAASEQIADSSARAQALMDEGSRHFDKKEWALAREYFLKAWELLQHHTIAANLAEVEIRLGLYREAAEHLSFVLAQALPTRARISPSPRRSSTNASSTSQ
jgi:tetratricopeptide (TPR) repeat protein